MSSTSIMDRRKVTAARRFRPRRPDSLTISAQSDGDLGPDVAPRPTDLFLEATTPEGQPAVWFSDDWWLNALKRWKDHTLTIHILYTPAALTHEVVEHELAMVRRLKVPWRLIGHCYLSDIANPVTLHHLACSHYDEIRIIDADRPKTPSFAVTPARMTLTELIAAFREIQAAEQTALPLLTRRPNPDR